MTPDAFRAAALALTGAHEEPHFERTSFRVGKKIFATMSLGEESIGEEGPTGVDVMVPVKPIARCLELLASDPATYVDHGGWTRRFGSLGVRLARVRSKADVAALVGLLGEAHARVEEKGGGRRGRAGAR